MFKKSILRSQNESENCNPLLSHFYAVYNVTIHTFIFSKIFRNFPKCFESKIFSNSYPFFEKNRKQIEKFDFRFSKKIKVCYNPPIGTVDELSTSCTWCCGWGWLGFGGGTLWSRSGLEVLPECPRPWCPKVATRGMNGADLPKRFGFSECY